MLLPCQGVVTAWWMLGEVGSRAPAGALDPAADMPALLPRLAKAAASAAGSMHFQGISQVGTQSWRRCNMPRRIQAKHEHYKHWSTVVQVLNACVKIGPALYRDEVLLHALITAAACR